jgi:hypothetical protein
MTDHDKRTRGVLIALLAGVALVIVIALIAVFTRGGTATLDPESPEGVVQQYSQAVIEGDTPAAIELLIPEIAEDCRRTGGGDGDHRVTLTETTVNGDSARVEVVIATVYGSGPLGPDEYESDGVFQLEQVGGQWLIATTPWELTVCDQSGAGL